MKEKQRKGIAFKLLAIFLIITIGVIVFLINQESIIDFIDSNNIGLNKSIEEVSSLKSVGSIEVKGDIDEVGLYENDLIILSNKKLRRLKIDGSIEWEKDFNFTDPMVSFGEERIYIFDKVTGEIYILNLAGETLDKIELHSEIKNLIEDSNNILVHTKDGDSEVENMKILSKDGDIVIDYSLEDGNILTYSIAKDKGSYLVSNLDLREDKLKSRLEKYKIDGEELYSSNFNDEIILYSSFIERDKLVIMSDSSLYLLDGQNIIWEKKLQLVKDIYINDEKINILYGNILEVLSFEGETKWKYSFPEEYDKIAPFNKNAILYGDEHVIALKDGEELFEYNFEKGILEVINNKDYLFIIYENKVDILSL